MQPGEKIVPKEEFCKKAITKAKEAAALSDSCGSPFVVTIS